MMKPTQYLIPLFVAWAATTSGCSSKGGTTGAGGNSTKSTAQSSSTGPDPHYACMETGYSATPLSGPGYDASKGGFTGTPASSYIVSSTVVYTDPSQDAGFFKALKPVIAEIGSADGLVASSLGSDSECHVYRTLVVWENTDKMYAFVASSAHASAAAQTKDISMTGKVTHWSATADEVKALTWDVARQHLADVQPLSVY